MITSLEIQNFKAFRHLTIGKLAKVNLFVGEGNSGKTTLLEGVSHIAYHHPPARSDEIRLLPKDEFHKVSATALHEMKRWDLSHLDESNTTLISCMDQEKRTFSWPPTRNELARSGAKAGLSAPRISLVPTFRLAPNDLARQFDLWTRRDGDEERFVAFAKSVDPRVKSLRPKEHTGVRMLYASIGLPELIPLPLLGEGLNRLIEIYGTIIGEGADIVLIDEIENGLHWKALPKVWQGIRAVVDAEDVQIFATTHSIECIEAASETFKGPPDDFAVHRLERRDDGDIHCVTIGEVELTGMLEHGWEVR